MFTPEVISFLAFIALITFLLTLDLGVFHKDDHIVSFKEATIWTIVWISIALLFGVFLLFRAEWIHGISSIDELMAVCTKFGYNIPIDSNTSLEEGISLFRHEAGLEYYTGYFIEKSLSLDNIFVMIMIFISFGINKKYYHRILFWGIIGAIVLRFIFIFGASVLIQKFTWVLAVFGFVLVYSGIHMFFSKMDEKIDTKNHVVVKFVSKHFRMLGSYEGHNFFKKVNGKMLITPMFLVLMVIEFSDIVFAVDSIPAIFSITQDPYIVFFSNIFAILGLRSLFFMLDSVMNKFWLLKVGLGILLIFVGAKMLLNTLLDIEIDTVASMLTIVGIIFVSIFVSLLFPRKEKTDSVDSLQQ